VKKWILLIAGALAVACGAAQAHHSQAMFDPNKLVMLQGTVSSFSYLNPHSWIGITGSVDGKGPDERWDIEAVAPGAMARLGINANTLKPGDKVTVAIRPLRDGRRAGSMIYIMTADGKTFGADPKALERQPQ
jgi:Family of unknown function (DUF6152)